MRRDQHHELAIYVSNSEERLRPVGGDFKILSALSRICLISAKWHMVLKSIWRDGGD